MGWLHRLSLVIGLGFLWVLLDNQRQGWHDTLAGTCVLYTRPVQPDEAAHAEAADAACSAGSTLKPHLRPPLPTSMTSLKVNLLRQR